MIFSPFPHLSSPAIGGLYRPFAHLSTQEECGLYFPFTHLNVETPQTQYGERKSKLTAYLIHKEQRDDD